MINLDENKDIDEYLKEILENVSILRLQLEIINKWYYDDWLKIYDEKISLYEKKYKILSKKWKCWETFIYTCVYEPKWYQFYAFLRTFFEILKNYLDKKCIDHRRHKDMWESSKKIKYYIDLIFEKKDYGDDKKISELKHLISHLSELLHCLSIYFERQNKKEEKNEESEDPNQTLKKIVNLLINKNEITIDKECENSTLNCLNFIKKNLIKEFNKVINKKNKKLSF